MEGLDRASPQDLAMRKNVQSSLATSLHELSVSFRRDQKKYLEKLRENEAKSRYRPAAGTKGENKDLDGFEDSGFSAGQLADLQEIEETAEDREQEISKVLCVCVCVVCACVCVYWCMLVCRCTCVVLETLAATAGDREQASWKGPVALCVLVCVYTFG